MPGTQSSSEYQNQPSPGVTCTESPLKQANFQIKPQKIAMGGGLLPPRPGPPSTKVKKRQPELAAPLLN